MKSSRLTFSAENCSIKVDKSMYSIMMISVSRLNECKYIVVETAKSHITVSTVPISKTHFNLIDIRPQRYFIVAILFTPVSQISTVLV